VREFVTLAQRFPFPCYDAFGVGPSERNPVRTKANFERKRNRFSFSRDFVLNLLIGFIFDGFRNVNVCRI